VTSESPRQGAAKPQVWFPETSALVTLAVHLPLQQAVVAALSPHRRVLVKAVVTELEGLAMTSDSTATWAGTALGQLDWLGEPVPLDDRATVEAVGAAAAARGVTRAQISLAWLGRHPVVVAPLVGASSTTQIDEAVASLDIDLTDDEADALEAHYTPRYDFQGISDDTQLARIMARIPGFRPAGA
jgi:Aldo/keto reductase family